MGLEGKQGRKGDNGPPGPRGDSGDRGPRGIIGTRVLTKHKNDEMTVHTFFIKHFGSYSNSLYKFLLCRSLIQSM